MVKNVLRWVLLVLALVLVAFLVTSPIPVAGAEGLTGVPAYEPVTLTAESVTPIPYTDKTPYEPHASGYLPDKAGYLDPSISVKVVPYRAYDTDMDVVWVQIADASQLRAAGYATFPSKKTIAGTRLAKREKAVLAFTGDSIVHMKTGWSVRNTQVLRERYNDNDAHEFDALCIDAKGDLTILRNMDKAKVTAYQAEHDLVHAFTFGPGLVVDGEVIAEFGSRFKPTHRAQRVAIGQMDELSYVIVVTDGPDDKSSTGLTLYELAELFGRLGAKQAYDLDGGSSSWLVLDGERLNGKEGSKHRDIYDIIYFATAVPEEASAQ